jgi:hypothetical protein
MKKEKSFFKKKSVINSFAIIALLGGFFFLNKRITGNVILNNYYSFSLISLIGLLLIICSIILGTYSIWKKD